MQIKKIIVVGAGPAGLMAAIRASQLKTDVTLIEKNPLCGRKLLLSGKGRCNLTNSCEIGIFLKRFFGNGAFLRDAFKKFFNTELIEFFETRGLKIKIERQKRVFPATDKADSVVEVLKKELQKNKVKVIYRAKVEDILLRDNQVKGVILADNTCIGTDRLILATGGASYTFTGSDGESLKLVQRLGHAIVPLRPGLVPFESAQKFPKILSGLSLKNIRIVFSDGKNRIVSDIGELLFTDFGISGPLVITLSAKIGEWLEVGKRVFAEIDLKPGLSAEQLNARLMREFTENAKKRVKNALKNFLPLRLIEVFIKLAKIDPQKLCAQVRRKERQNLISLFKALRLEITRTRPLEDAMVTRGGVSLKSINPRTMESRIIKGLYFCGEMIDVDADTGGFNLQAAFSTGYLAGESAALNFK